MRRMYSENQLLKGIESQAKENGIKIFEDIVDKDGHPRYIEGDINVSTVAPSGFTKEFGRWSLSGSHLMFVGVFAIADTTVIADFTVLAICEDMPSWIYDKIYALFGSQNNIIDQKTFKAYAVNGLNQDMEIRLLKTNDKIGYQITAGLTLSAARKVRIAFDLIID